MDDLILPQQHQTGVWGRDFAPTSLGDSSVKLLFPWVLCGEGGSEGSPPGEPEGRLHLTHWS